jgi:exonuclease SbcD
LRIVHTSDWHLGRLFHNVHLTNDQAHVLVELVALLKDVRPDLLIVAGDVYDRAVPPAEAVELLDDVLHSIVVDLKIPTVMVAGNHDSPERLGFGARLLRAQGLFVAGTLEQALSPISFDDAFGKVEVIPIPFAAPEQVREWCGDESMRDHAAAMQALVDRARAVRANGVRSVLVAHTYVQGGAQSESERVLEVGGAGAVPAGVFSGFDYVALGHLHRAQPVGRGAIRYAGSLLKYAFGEADHVKSVSIVEMDAKGAVQVSLEPLQARYDVRVLAGTLKDVLERGAADPNRSDYVSVVLEDREPLFDAMTRLREVYPNVLHLARPHFGAATGDAKPADQIRKLSTLDLFEAFFSQVVDEELTAPQRAEIIDVIERVERDDEATP